MTYLATRWVKKRHSEANMLPSLYTLRTEYQELAQKLSILDLDAQTIADTIEASGLIDSIAEKGQNLVLVARSFEQHIDAIDTEIKRLQALKKRRTATATQLREYLLNNMIAAEITRIEGPLMSISIRNNTPSVDVFDADQVPVEYLKQPEPPPPAPDKKAIATAIKSGADVPGCRLVKSKRLVEE